MSDIHEVPCAWCENTIKVGDDVVLSLPLVEKETSERFDGFWNEGALEVDGDMVSCTDADCARGMDASGVLSIDENGLCVQYYEYEDVNANEDE